MCQSGWQAEIRTESNGQVGYCHLKNGQVVEEWELLHMNQPKCIADQAAELVGQSNLTEAQIKTENQGTNCTYGRTGSSGDYGLS